MQEKKFVAFSGGADSTALALLEPDAQPVFTDTKWEFDEIYEHLDRFEKVTGRKVLRVNHPDWPGGLPEYIRHYAFLPGHGSRFCTRVFKLWVFNHLIEKELPATLMIGLRADEPADERVGNLTEMDGLTIRYPLRERGLNRVDIIKICADHDLVPRKQPFSARGGCVGCFYKRRSEVIALILFRREVALKLADLEDEVQDERGKYAYMFPNIGKSVRQLIEEVDSQPMLFDLEQVYAQANDKSDMGEVCGIFCNR